MFSHTAQRAISTAVLTLVLVSSHDVWAQSRATLIEEVVVVGYRRLQLEEILKHIAIKAGDDYAQENVDRDFNSVLNLGLFDKKSSRVLAEPGLRGGLVLIFEVHELPLIDHIEFEGWPASISQLELLERLKTKAKVVKDAVYDPVNGKRALRLVGEHLQTQGLPNAEVSVMLEQPEMDKVIVKFEIKARF